MFLENYMLTRKSCAKMKEENKRIQMCKCKTKLEVY